MRSVSKNISTSPLDLQLNCVIKLNDDKAFSFRGRLRVSAFAEREALKLTTGVLEADTASSFPSDGEAIVASRSAHRGFPFSQDRIAYLNFHGINSFHVLPRLSMKRDTRNSAASFVLCSFRS